MAIPVDASQSAVHPAPSQLFSAREIAELALQKIGAFTTNDDGADSNEVDRALEHMELEVAELAGTETCQWLVPGIIDLSLEPGVALYDDLPDALGSELPSTQIAYVVSASIMDSSGSETPINVVRRRHYDEIDTKSTSGPPDQVFIDRNNDEPRAYVYPVPVENPAGSGLTGLTLRLRVHTYAPTVLGAESAQTAGDQRHGLDRAWQKWLVTQTAAAIGDGPVRQLTDAKLTRLIKSAIDSKLGLMAFQNREKHSNRLRRTRPWAR